MTGPVSARSGYGDISTYMCACFVHRAFALSPWVGSSRCSLRPTAAATPRTKPQKIPALAVIRQPALALPAARTTPQVVEHQPRTTLVHPRRMIPATQAITVQMVNVALGRLGVTVSLDSSAARPTAFGGRRRVAAATPRTAPPLIARCSTVATARPGRRASIRLAGGGRTAGSTRPSSAVACASVQISCGAAGRASCCARRRPASGLASASGSSMAARWVIAIPSVATEIASVWAERCIVSA